MVDNGYTNCYTIPMKTAISIDKNLFNAAERFSRTSGLSRSKLYCTALDEYIQNHSPDIITEKLNNYYNNHASRLDDDLKGAVYNVFAREDW